LALTAAKLSNTRIRRTNRAKVGHQSGAQLQILVVWVRRKQPAASPVARWAIDRRKPMATLSVPLTMPLVRCGQV
jgi:hypothetical protein